MMRRSLGRRQLSLVLLLILNQALTVAADVALTAVRKNAPNSSEKILREHLAFTPILPLEAVEDGSLGANITTRFYPAYNIHDDYVQSSQFHRAIESFSVLQKRSACPSGFGDCSNVGSPNKCCIQGTYCSTVTDDSTGNIACCPDESTCGGTVGKCPSDAVTCSADLGGGCCIAGYVCQGIGCVPSALATQEATQTATSVVQGTSTEAGTETVTRTQTTLIEGNPTTVVVTVVVTGVSSAKTQTKTTTITQSATNTEPSSSATGTVTGTATGGAPYRGTILSETTTETADTQTGCPTGFYGCSATHGGGCCRTDQNCDVHDCPASPSTTFEAGGATVVVAVTSGAARAAATSSCANGWFLCGTDAGPIPGCCPSGFSCGTASCFTTTASRTEARQKEFPTAASKKSGSSRTLASGGVALAMAMLASTVALIMSFEI